MAIISHFHVHSTESVISWSGDQTDSLDIARSVPAPATDDRVVLFLDDQGWSDLLRICVERMVDRVGVGGAREVTQRVLTDAANAHVAKTS